MQPRITKISRLHRHPTNQALFIVQVFGSEHRSVVRRDMTQLNVNDRVVFMPVGTFLTESTAIALGITFHCRKELRFESGEQQRQQQQLCRVVAVDYERIISHGVVMTLFSVANKMSIENPYSPNSTAVLNCLRVEHKSAGLLLEKPLVDLLDNPSLLNILLQTPVWLSERLKGTPICIQYDACRDCVHYWDESNVSTPHAWWTVAKERNKVKELEFPRILTPFSSALIRVGRERYGKAVDLYLRGVISQVTSGGDNDDNDPADAAFFYECALHGARSFILSAEQFLRMCETSRFPRMPTLYTNRTLSSIINERLGKRRILLALNDISFVKPKQTIRQKENELHLHRYRTKEDDETETESEKWEKQDARQGKRTFDYAKSAPSTRYLDTSSSSNSLSTSPPSASLLNSAQSLSGGGGGKGGGGIGGGGANSREKLFGGARRRKDDRDDGIASHQTNWRRTTPIDESSGGVRETASLRRRGYGDVDIDRDFESDWFGGISRDRVDWAQCLILIANQLHERLPNTIGLAIQVYSGGDLLRLLEQFTYMRCRVGAEVVCEQHLLKRKKNMTV